MQPGPMSVTLSWWQGQTLLATKQLPFSRLQPRSTAVSVATAWPFAVQPGAYTVKETTGQTASATVTVSAAQAKQANQAAQATVHHLPAAPIPWWMWVLAGIGGMALLAGAALLWLWRRANRRSLVFHRQHPHSPAQVLGAGQGVSGSRGHTWQTRRRGVA